MSDRVQLKLLQVKINFLNVQIDQALKVFLQNESEVGIVELWADANYHLTSAKFIKRRFKRNRFAILPALPPPGSKVIGVKWMYVHVLWSSDHTIWLLKHPILEYEKADKDYMATLNLISDN